MNEENATIIRVLLIEDNTAHAELVRGMLSEADCVTYRITQMTRLADGLRHLTANYPDVILLDLRLPDSKGFETFMQIQSHTQTHNKQIPIIVLSSINDENLAVEAVRKGAQDYLVKAQVSAPLLARAIRYAIERNQLQRELEHRNQELLILNNISTTVSSTLDLDQTLHETLDSLLKSSHIPSSDINGAVFLRDDWSGDLHPAAQSGMSADYPCLVWPPYAERCLCGQAIQQDEIVVADPDNQVGWCHQNTQAPSDSRRVCLPLKVRGQTRGVLVLGIPKTWQITDEQLALFKSISGQIGIAIENTRLHNVAQQRSRELAALNRTGKALVSTLDREEALSSITSEVRAMLNADRASILLLSPDGDDLVVAAGDGIGAEALQGWRQPATEGIAGWALRLGEPILNEDAQRDPHFTGQMDALSGVTTHAMLTAPMTYRDRDVGVIQVVNRTRDHFETDDISLLKTIAGSAAIAIENARLYQETTRRLTDTEILREVMLAAASTLDFDEVLSRTLYAIQGALGIERLFFLLPDESGQTLAANAQYVIGAEIPSADTVRMPINGSVCGRAYRTSQPELVNETETCDYFYRVPITEEIRSIIAIPVEVKDRVIAVLAATSTVAHAFSQDDLRILEAIGAQLGVAMENARLYEAEREQRKLLEQSQLQLIQSEKLAATGQLAASLAHEINNPLQAIRTGIQLSQALAEPSSQQREYLDMADRELQRLTNLVNHTLDFARRPQPEGQPVNVNRVLKQVFALASKYLQHRHVVLRTDLLPDPPDVVTSPGQLGQVFLNLILNAVDAMPEGGTLRVSSHLQDGGLAVRFIDTGHGIEPDNMDKIFEPFFSTKQDGTGLGLPISRTILQRHDGTIDVTSTVGEGTTFEVWLPQPPTAATERSVS